MLIEVIPTKKLPRQLSKLSYLAPKELKPKIKIGQLVRIPLRGSLTSGAVAEINKSDTRSKFPGVLKYIAGIISEKSIFTANQLQLFQELAEYYYVSASLFLHISAPKILKKEWDEFTSPPSKGPLDLLMPLLVRRGALARGVENELSHLRLLYWHNLDQRNQYYLDIINQASQNNKQILMLVPRINQIKAIIEALRLDINQVNILRGNLTRREKAERWIQAMTGTGIFIGTRSAVFYPYTNLSAIIIDEEESIDHKNYDMNPRYDARVVAEKMGVKLILSSTSPSVETYYKFPSQFIGVKGANKLAGNFIQIIAVNLNNEFRRQNYSFISEKLEQEIKTAINNKQPVFLLINKKGESSSTNCLDCNYVFNCSECGLPLIKDKDNIFHCYYCNYTEELPPFCPKCQGPKFKSAGLGIEKIEKNLQQIFPDLNIARLDKTSGKRPAVSGQRPVADIWLGTEFALDKIDWSKIGLLGIINADQLWQHAEFGTSEKAYSLLNKLLTLAPTNAKFIIQTFKPDHYIIQSMANNQPGIFYDQELAIRKSFDYPPFRHLIKLSILNKNQAKAEKEIKQLYNKIKTAAKTGVDASEPIPILRRKIRGKYKYNIILKLERLSDFDKLVKYVPNDGIIDVGARTLLD